MKLQLINDVRSLKVTDNGTVIEYAVLNNEMRRLSLSTFTEILVRIGKDNTYLVEEIATITPDNTFQFKLTTALEDGIYRMDFVLKQVDETTIILPHGGYERLDITTSFNAAGETIPIRSISEVLEEIHTARDEVVGAADDIAALKNEVVDARNDVSNVTHANLKLRLDTIENKTSTASLHTFYCGVSTGTNTKALSNALIKALEIGLNITFQNNSLNTSTAMALNINGLGARNLYNVDGTAIPVGGLKPSAFITAVYNGTSFYLLSATAVQEAITTTNMNIGTLTSLQTTDKTSLVNAINELVTKVNGLTI